LAWAGDCVPDSQKGLLGGLMALAPAMGALSGFIVTWEQLAAVEHRLLWVAACTFLCVAPVLLFGQPRPLTMPESAGYAQQSAIPAMNVVTRMWLARLLVQIAEAALFAFLLLWFRSIDPSFAENMVARIFAAVLGGAVLLALWFGDWSDRHKSPSSRSC
jgi:hypothetical protein